MTNSSGTNSNRRAAAGLKGEGRDSPSNIPRYPEYKDSGVKWLGEVPAHWDSKSLRNLVTNNNAGEVIDRSYWGGDAELLYTCALQPLGCDFPAFPAYKRTARNDLLLTRNGTPYVHKPLANSIYTNVVQRVSLNRELNRDFIATSLQNSADNLKGYGVSIESLNYDMWKSLAIAIPPLTEQTAIAAFLDRETGKIDALVAEQEKLIALLKEKRQALISHAVTKGLDPTVPMKDSGIEWLSEVPAHWDALRLGSIFREAIDNGNDALPILSVSIHDGVSDKELDESEMDRKVTRSDDRSKYKAVCAGDLAYNMMRAWQGGFGAVTVDGQVSPAYVVARPIRNVRTAFVELLLRTPQAVEQMRRYSRGITDFRLRLYWEEFKNLRIALPPTTEQGAILAEIARETKTFDALTAEADRSIDLLKERRSALISAAVTGKIDVRGLVTEAA